MLRTALLYASAARASDAMPFVSSLPLSGLIHAAIVATGLLVYVLVTRIGQQRRHPSAALAWVVAIVAFPYLAVPLFLLLGTRKFARPPRRGAVCARQLQSAAAPLPEWAATLLAALDVDGSCANASVEFQPDGKRSLDALIDVCNGARRRLDVCTFILGDDEVGAAVADALAAAAARGVRTRLLLDAIGRLSASRAMLARLRAAGVDVLLFMPPLHNPMRGRTNLRNHRKLAVADDAYLWAGGRNLAIEYFLDQPGRPAWIDLSFTVEGPLAASAGAQFERDWRLAGGAVIDRAEPRAALAPAASGPIAQWVPTGPDCADDTVYALLLAATCHAADQILAVTPYFVPEEALLQAWCLACRRGVRLCLVLPQRSNHRMADLARERALRRLVEAGAEVRLVAGMVHAKAVVVDRSKALCGSVNLDSRSLFLNYEVMTAFYGTAEIDWLAGWIRELARQGAAYRARPPSLAGDILEGVVRALAFQL